MPLPLGMRRGMGAMPIGMPSITHGGWQGNMGHKPGSMPQVYKGMAPLGGALRQPGIQPAAPVKLNAPQAARIPGMPSMINRKIY